MYGLSWLDMSWCNMTCHGMTVHFMGMQPFASSWGNIQQPPVVVSWLGMACMAWLDIAWLNFIWHDMSSWYMIWQDIAWQGIRKWHGMQPFILLICHVSNQLLYHCLTHHYMAWHDGMTCYDFIKKTTWKAMQPLKLVIYCHVSKNSLSIAWHDMKFLIALCVITRKVCVMAWT